MASKYGFVYVLSNSIMPGTYKVGMTERSPHQRAEELSRGTGVPEEYDVVYYAEVQAPSEVEKRVHDSLAAHRGNQSREFFKCPLAKIIGTIEDTDEVLSEYFSDLAIEARNPGCVFPHDPLFFEKNLYSPGELLAIVNNGVRQ